MVRQLFLILGGLGALSVLVAGALISYSDSLPHAGKNSMTLQSFSICESSCFYGNALITGNVVVNTSEPLQSMKLSINGVDEFLSNYVNYGVGNYSIPYRVSLNNQSLPIVTGRSYRITLVATFQDNSSLSASSDVIAVR
jgi:hypothetical protein